MTHTSNLKTMANRKARQAKQAKKQKEKEVKTKEKAKKLEEEERERSDWEALEQLEQDKKRREIEEKTKEHAREQIREYTRATMEVRVNALLRADALLQAKSTTSAMVPNIGKADIRPSSGSAYHQWQGINTLESSGSDLVSAALFSESTNTEETLFVPIVPYDTRVDECPAANSPIVDNDSAEDRLLVQPNDEEEVTPTSSVPLGDINYTEKDLPTPSTLETCKKTQIPTICSALPSTTAVTDFLLVWAAALNTDCRKESLSTPSACPELPATIKPASQEWYPIPNGERQLFSEVTRIPILAMGENVEAQVIRAAENGDTSPITAFKKEVIGVYKGDGFPYMYRWPEAARMIELEEEVMRLCAMDADRVWDYNGVLKYYPQYLTQKPCRPLYLLSIPLSHLEIHFLRVFQDERMWQGAIVPWLRKQLGDTYETCKPVYNLIDQRDAFRKQRGNVHDFIAAATCAPKWAATQLQRNGTLLSGLIHEVVKYYRSRSYAVDLCRTFFGDGYEADDQKWILKVCSDSEAFDYVVLYENENERLDFAYATKSCFPDEFRTLRRIPDSVRD